MNLFNIWDAFQFRKHVNYFDKKERKKICVTNKLEKLYNIQKAMNLFNIWDAAK